MSDYGPSPDLNGDGLPSHIEQGVEQGLGDKPVHEGPIDADGFPVASPADLGEKLTSDDPVAAEVDVDLERLRREVLGFYDD